MQEEELKNRTSKAWAKYNIHKADLTNDKLPIELRLRLFNATVTPTMMYGSGSWVLTEQMRNDIRTQQRKMLRCIARCHRSFPKSPHSVEDYVEWIQAATEKTDRLMRQFNVQDLARRTNKTKLYLQPYLFAHLIFSAMRILSWQSDNRKWRVSTNTALM